MQFESAASESQGHMLSDSRQRANSCIFSNCSPGLTRSNKIYEIPLDISISKSQTVQQLVYISTEMPKILIFNLIY
jgi:hypothetical protein